MIDFINVKFKQLVYQLLLQPFDAMWSISFQVNFMINETQSNLIHN